jgi:hypothetical protein
MIMRIFIAILGAGLALGSIAEPAEAQVRAGVVVDRDGLASFHVEVGRTYGTPVREIERYHSPRLHRDEIPVVYFLAREARVSPRRVIDLRERGWSWIRITRYLRVDPRVFVAHLPRHGGPPYGNAHGYWRQVERKQLNRLSDRQIVDYVNLAFWADYHRQPVERIIVVREREGSWLRMAAHWDAPRQSVRRAADRRPPPIVAPTVERRSAEYKEQPRPQPRGRARGGNPGRGGRGG